MSNMRQTIRMLRWHLGHTLPMIARHTSTYPELPRKSVLRRYLENLYIYLRDGSPCAAYDGLGLDVKGRGIGDFMGNHRWLKFLLKELAGQALGACTPMQRLMGLATCPILLLQDKYCFWSFLSQHGLPTIPVIAHTIGGSFFATQGVDAMEAHDRLFVKPVAANCGTNAFVLSRRDGRFYAGEREVKLNELSVGGSDFIVQPLVTNHPDIRAFNRSTLNTLRIVTCRTRNQEIELWDPGMMRIGRVGAEVDNFAKGGIGVGIDETGHLREYGFMHDKMLCYQKIDHHPDSKLPFKGHTIPCYGESVGLAKKAHALFPTLKTIGWDIAITSNGPMFVEGNHDWDMEMLQVVHHKGAAGRFWEIYGR